MKTAIASFIILITCASAWAFEIKNVNLYLSRERYSCQVTTDGNMETWLCR